MAMDPARSAARQECDGGRRKSPRPGGDESQPLGDGVHIDEAPGDEAPGDETSGDAGGRLDRPRIDDRNSPSPSHESRGPAEQRWQSFLASELRCPVRVVYTRARRTPVQVRPVEKRRGAGRLPVSGLEVRMHSMFDSAPPEVFRAVASWIRSGRRAPRACALLDRWIMESLERLPVLRARASEVRPGGRHHDLQRLAHDLLERELGADFASSDRWPVVTWGRRGASRTRHSLRLGSFDPEGSLVRIHPVLDQPAVPAWFVRYVLFHECLHAALPPRPGSGARWIHHSAQFRRREKAYADYGRALAWEEAHMHELIRSARRGTPMRIVAAKATETQPVTPAKKRGLLQRLLFLD